MVTLKSLYQHVFPVVARYIAKRGGTLEEAKDVFHDALLVYYEKARDRRLDLQRSEAAYIYGVARHLWIKRYKENQRYQSLHLLLDGAEDDETKLETFGMDDAIEGKLGWAGNRMMRILQTAGQKCMQLLTAFYYERLDMNELAGRFGFSGTRSATVQKFKCLQKVKQIVKEKSLQYEDFIG